MAALRSGQRLLTAVVVTHDDRQLKRLHTLSVGSEWTGWPPAGVVGRHIGRMRVRREESPGSAGHGDG